MYEFGTIVLVPFPFTDLTAQKVRPALIISSNTNNKNSRDLILAFISSQNKQFGNAFPIKSTHTDFHLSGLKVDSSVRLNKLATLDKKLLLGELGKLSPKMLKEIAPVFRQTFGF
jgi:mRNA interferase MazF